MTSKVPGTNRHPCANSCKNGIETATERNRLSVIVEAYASNETHHKASGT